MLRNKLVLCLVIHFFLFFSFYHHAYAFDKPVDEGVGSTISADLERTKALLQKGLDIYELDQEIARLSEKEVLVILEIETVEREIPLQMALVQESKDHAAQVLRSYYLGERDNLPLLLLSSQSFSEVLAAIEFIGAIITNDQRKLDDYRSSLLQLENLQHKLTEALASLQDIKQQFLAQREALLTMQDEIDRELAEHEEAEKILEMIAQLTADWQERGLPVFRHYLQALAEAMEQLPNIQTMFNDVISLRGSNIQFQITDVQLNEFLISENAIFEQLTFRFNENDVEAEGQHDDMLLTIKGHFDLELEPDNVMRYYIDELMYNEFILPESTRRALEEQFSFGFYPGKMSFFGLKFKATELHTEPGLLRVTLKLV